MNKEQAIQPDARWSKVWRINSLQEYFENMVPALYINEEAPQSVKDGFSLTWKLLRHAYFEYEFIDLALTHSIITLERALKIKHMELNGASKRMTLQALLNWFSEKGYFEPTNPQIWDQLRSIRNGKVHDITHSLGGIAFLKKVLTPLQLVNDLYEDRETRQKRQVERVSIQNHLKANLKDGGILELGEKRFIVMDSWVAFVNNKSVPKTISLVTLPIFDPAPYLSNTKSSFPTICLNVKNFKTHKGEVILTGVNSDTEEVVTMKKIEDSVNREKFAQLKDSSVPILQDPFLLGFSIDSALNEVFLYQRERLHHLPH